MIFASPILELFTKIIRTCKEENKKIIFFLARGSLENGIIFSIQ